MSTSADPADEHYTQRRGPAWIVGVAAVIALLGISLASSCDAGSLGVVVPTSGAVIVLPTDSASVAIRAQNQLIRKYDDKLLSTVHWALGGVMATALALLGFGWFANMRTYDRDKAALSQELRSLMTAELKSALDQIRALAHEQNKNFTNVVDTRARAVVESATASMSEELRDVRHELRHLQSDSYEQAAQQALQSNKHALALLFLKRRLKVTMDLKYDWLISETLELIQPILRHIATNGTNPLPSAGLIRELNEQLSALAPEHSIAVEEARRLLVLVGALR